MDPLPEKLTRGPKFLQKCVNSNRDFSIASRVVNVIVRERYDASEPLHCLQRHTPGGELWTIVVGGGQPVPPRPFELIGRVDLTDPDAPLYFVRVVYSTLDGLSPTGFSLSDDPIFELEVTSYSPTGYIYGHVAKDLTTPFATTTREILAAATVPDDTSGNIYGEIGNFTIDEDAETIETVNAGYGPVAVCRDWFSNPASYGFEFSGG